MSTSTQQVIPIDLTRVLLQPDVIDLRVNTLARQISKDYDNVEQLYIIGILKGAFIFLADLCRKLTIPHVVDFMALSSYGKKAASGAVRIMMDLRESIEGKHVLVVEDILDTGNTLNYLLHTLQDRQPASLRTCVLMHKTTRQSSAPIDYLGFEIPDVWVVGYGLDYADNYRTLPYVAELDHSVYHPQVE
jgi:hypoxanthine phosphoribosyltransferase